MFIIGTFWTIPVPVDNCCLRVFFKIGNLAACQTGRGDLIRDREMKTEYFPSSSKGPSARLKMFFWMFIKFSCSSLKVFAIATKSKQLCHKIARNRGPHYTSSIFRYLSTKKVDFFTLPRVLNKNANDNVSLGVPSFIFCSSFVDWNSIRLQIFVFKVSAQLSSFESKRHSQPTQLLTIIDTPRIVTQSPGPLKVHIRIFLATLLIWIQIMLYYGRGSPENVSKCKFGNWKPAKSDKLGFSVDLRCEHSLASLFAQTYQIV